jgi:hypothetical protein
MILTLLSWIAGAIALAFITLCLGKETSLSMEDSYQLCLACGLYYMAEFVEEHTVSAKLAIQRTFMVQFHVLEIFQLS